MRRGLIWLIILTLLLGMAPLSRAAADGTYVDERFQGVYTTANLDAILEEYELNDGWYWTTPHDVYQDFHGHEDKPGWTETSEKNKHFLKYAWGWVGCRWNWDRVYGGIPNGDGWGECFGFAQFIGYLLSGERNPHGNWKAFKSIKDSDGLRVGDIVRVECEDKDGVYRHSAVVYQVDGDEVLFLQVAGGNYNELRIRQGYMGGNLNGATSMEVISKSPGLTVYRSPDNLIDRPADETEADAAAQVQASETQATEAPADGQEQDQTVYTATFATPRPTEAPTDAADEKQETQEKKEQPQTTPRPAWRVTNSSK